jgi:hypothetical protein
MPKPKHNIPADKLHFYEKLVATNPEVERKGAANPYTSRNGHMFTFLNPQGVLGLRLPEDEREKFVQKYRTPPFESYGIVMKEYVTVPDNLLKQTAELKKYFDISFNYIGTLKPKPTTKAKAKKSEARL